MKLTTIPVKHTANATEKAAQQTEAAKIPRLRKIPNHNHAYESPTPKINASYSLVE